MITGIRSDYELVGWFYDSAFTQPFSFETHLVDSTVPDTYDKSRTSEVDDIYGLPLGEKRTDTDGKDYVWDTEAEDWLLEDGKKVPWNKDESRFWITRSLDLFAKWRSKIDGAKGINVEYYNGNTLVSADPDQYLDQAQAIAIAAPAAANADEEFKCWVVLHWNGTEYVEVDGAQRVLPDDGFTVLKSDSYERALTEEELATAPDGVTKKYTVRLKAVFGPIESETKTKLNYNGNEGELVSGYTVPDGYPTPAVSGNVITFEGLTINADYEALGAVFARPGYKFLGWATAANATSAQFTAGQMIAPDILDGEVNTLYAVWEEKTVSFNYVAVGPEGATDFGSVTPETDANNAIKVFSGTAAGSTASANEGFRFVGWFSDEACETKVGDNTEFVPQKTGDPGHYPYGDADTMTVTFYAKFEYDTTTLTVTNSTGHDAIFTISGKGYGTDGGSPIVVAIPNGQSVTIANVYVGETYTVSEDGNWSWRYTPYSGSTNALVAGINPFSVPLETPVRTYWLSGTSYYWKSKPALAVPSN
jgi:hypothetical protein